MAGGQPPDSVRAAPGSTLGHVATSTLPVPPGLCRRCLRALSRRLRDVPGVVSFEVDAAAGRVVVRGDADPAALSAALAPGPAHAPGTTSPLS